MRAVDHDIKPGAKSEESEEDAWQELRDKILAADLLVLATPIWVG